MEINQQQNSIQTQLKNAAENMIINHKRSNGRSVSNGKLEILLLDRNLAKIHDDVQLEIQQFIDDTNATNVNISEWLSETTRLCYLAQRIVDDPNFDIFQYLPLTKSGAFPKNKNILIAQSKCKYGDHYEYPVARHIEIRLVPAYSGLVSWLNNERLDNVMILSVQMADALRKQTPVFDEHEIPSKPDTTRAKYLRDDEIQPGRVYEEKSGAQFLVLTGCTFKATVTYTRDYGPLEGRTSTYSQQVCEPNGRHTYLKWTKVLANAIGTDTSFNNIIRAAAARDKTSSLPERLSVRENPRKFVKEVAKLFDPKDIEPETIPGKNYRDNINNLLHHVTYEILPPAN